MDGIFQQPLWVVLIVWYKVRRAYKAQGVMNLGSIPVERWKALLLEMERLLRVVEAPEPHPEQHWWFSEWLKGRLERAAANRIRTLVGCIGAFIELMNSGYKIEGFNITFDS